MFFKNMRVLLWMLCAQMCFLLAEKTYGVSVLVKTPEKWCTIA